MADVAYMTCGIEVPAGACESIACSECDADDPGSIKDALAAGWTDIVWWDGFNAYFCGLCPDCRAEGLG